MSDRTAIFGAREGNEGIVRCDACPVLCRIRPGRAGACQRYANEDGRLVRTEPLVLLERTVAEDGRVVPFLEASRDWAGGIAPAEEYFVSAIGSGTTYPDYKPAPFIVQTEFRGVDTVTVVTEGIFSYAGVKVKIDTDRHLGPETAAVRYQGEVIGHVTTAEYGSQMLSLGGVHHLTGGSKKEGQVTCQAVLALSNKEAIDVEIEGGAKLTIQAGRAPIVNGVPEARMRVGCGAATIGIFAQQWQGHVDEVVVIDDHITGVLTEHQAGKCLDMRPGGVRVRGRRSTPGRYFQVAEPGAGWGGTTIENPLDAIESIDPKLAWPGMRMLMVSTTGEDSAWFELDDALKPIPARMPDAVRATVERIGENCEPAMTSVLFIAGAGGSLRAGVTENPIHLTRKVQSGEIRLTMGGAPCILWPGGGITIMADVLDMPDGSFGYVPTPALVAPLEFTMPADLYAAIGGHTAQAVPLAEILKEYGDTARRESLRGDLPWPGAPA
ncbi:6-hydroxynicotinate reductase [Rhodovarius crocodyli]|uniref:6-hydroxynicotinate reductase n=1 Tax=Rhodovarius crocodyli TaxID=1979269 RepID=A0A437LW67_9PROT|nr:6-hydroxynicotinate reductase [Rhodovarius crocodyli]RVT89620.1 6-hydroxynicotinate reductase [Rhodovarius crocodyli]